MFGRRYKSEDFLSSPKVSPLTTACFNILSASVCSLLHSTLCMFVIYSTFTKMCARLSSAILGSLTQSWLQTCPVPKTGRTSPLNSCNHTFTRRSKTAQKGIVYQGGMCIFQADFSSSGSLHVLRDLYREQSVLNSLSTCIISCGFGLEGTNADSKIFTGSVQGLLGQTKSSRLELSDLQINA